MDWPSRLDAAWNSAWSFLSRRRIQALRARYRCVAFDLAGFGLSQAPEGFSFLPEDQCKLISAALEALDIRDAALVAHDWGGPIGLGAMLAGNGRIARLTLGNTWARPVNGDSRSANSFMKARMSSGRSPTGSAIGRRDDVVQRTL
jgi:haloalkane dehalogenase